MPSSAKWSPNPTGPEQWVTGKKQLYFDMGDSYKEEGKVSSGELPSASGCTEIKRAACAKDTLYILFGCTVLRDFLCVTY